MDNITINAFGHTLTITGDMVNAFSVGAAVGLAIGGCAAFAGIKKAGVKAREEDMYRVLAQNDVLCSDLAEMRERFMKMQEQIIMYKKFEEKKEVKQNDVCCPDADSKKQIHDKFIEKLKNEKPDAFAKELRDPVETADAYMAAFCGDADEDEHTAEVIEISQEEFEKSEHKVYLEYYRENGAIADNEGAVDNAMYLLGTAWVDGLAKGKTEIFLRNRKLNIDFSIIVVDNKYPPEEAE